MHLLQRLCKSVLQKNLALVASSTRNIAIHRDWKPGPYPKTQEEREAAAKKYNLHPKDYKPYPDNGDGWGDYPMFDPVSEESRSDFEYYDSPEYKRNYGEVVHIDSVWYTATRVDINKEPSPAAHIQLLTFVSIVAIFFGCLKLSLVYDEGQPRMPKQLPFEEKKHYSFEIEN